MGNLKEDIPTRVPVRAIALATIIMCVASQLLWQMGDMDRYAPSAPIQIVIGQQFWNATQVGMLVVLLCLWRLKSGWLVGVMAIVTAVCLPFSIYAMSPGATVFSVVIVAVCGIVIALDLPDLGITIADAEASGTPALSKFEALAFLGMLLCSMYNFTGSGGMFPYWSSIFRYVDKYLAPTPGRVAISQWMFTLGLPGVVLPEFIQLGNTSNRIGAIVFTLIWTVHPFLYVLYFTACAKLAEQSPGTRVQQVLCIFCIVHFLFLTDVVDYGFGRGVVNPAAEWAHWSERFVWRVAILLPIYQKIASGQWLRGNGGLGVTLHYALLAWSAIFLIYVVLMFDVPRFYSFSVGGEPFKHRLFGSGLSGYLGYHAALVVMIFVYGVSLLALRCKRISISALSTIN